MNTRAPSYLHRHRITLFLKSDSAMSSDGFTSTCAGTEPQRGTLSPMPTLVRLNQILQYFIIPCTARVDLQWHEMQKESAANTYIPVCVYSGTDCKNKCIYFIPLAQLYDIYINTQPGKKLFSHAKLTCIKQGNKHVSLQYIRLSPKRSEMGSPWPWWHRV